LDSDNYLVIKKMMVGGDRKGESDGGGRIARSGGYRIKVLTCV
jgi:hypothetical protein